MSLCFVELAPGRVDRATGVKSQPFRVKRRKAVYSVLKAATAFLSSTALMDVVVVPRLNCFFTLVSHNFNALPFNASGHWLRPRCIFAKVKPMPNLSRHLPLKAFLLSPK